MSDEWTSPSEVIGECVKVWGRPALDPCWKPSSPVRPLTGLVYRHEGTAGDVRIVRCNGLGVEWFEYMDPSGWIYLNPPYSNPGRWLRRLEDMVALGYAARGAALIKCDPSTKAWCRYVWDSTIPCYVGFFRSRLSFGGDSDHSATFPSALIIYGKKRDGRNSLIDLPDLDIRWVDLT
jgi:hypothetical protein